MFIEAEHPFLPKRVYLQLDKNFMTPFATAIDVVEDPELRARIIDVAWQKRACDHALVQDGVSAYIASAKQLFDRDNWCDAYARLQRAVELGLSTGKQTGYRAAVEAVEATIARAGEDDPLYLVHRLLELLLRVGEGDPNRYSALAGRMAQRARRAYEAHGVANGLECERERAFLELQLRLCRRAKNWTLVDQLATDIAEANVRQADGVIAAGWPSAHAVASHFIEEAIVEYRKTSKHKERIEQLRHRHHELQRRAMEELVEVSATGDASTSAKHAREAVVGKPPLPALIALAFGHSPPVRSDVEEEVALQLKEASAKAFIPHAYVGPRGTTLASHSGVARDNIEAFDIETKRTAHSRQQTVAMFSIVPAAQQIAMEHGLDLTYFLALARRSSFVPQGREHSFARGLAAGLHMDFELAATLLYPQVEHAIRELFFQHGVVTTTLPSSGDQNEYDLNHLLRLERAAEIFGADQLFDLQVLLIEKAGANLRNDLAHGLIDDGDKTSAKVYLWWWTLRLVCFPLLSGLKGG